MALEDLGELALPAPLRPADFTGPEEWLAACRQALASALDGHIMLEGRPILPAGDFEERFWHAATKDVPWSSRRWLDPGRCEVMSQLPNLLERLAAGDPRAVAWQARWYSGRRRRHRKGHGGWDKVLHRSLKVAPLDFTFVARFTECNGAVWFGTLYPISRRNRRKTMEGAAGCELLPIPAA